MRARWTLFLCLLLGLTGCVGSEEDPTNPPLSRADVATGKADGDTDALCRYVGADAGCDLCEELDWYYDGICDGFCDQADPDCGTENEVCASLFDDGFADCQYEGWSASECLPDEGYDRDYHRACCDTGRSYDYCPHLACGDATDVDACLAEDGCAWGTGPDGDGCVYVGDVSADG